MRPIDFIDGKVMIIDQTKLCEKFEMKEIKTCDEMIEAIKTMQIRGAPAIGIAGAFSCYLASRETSDRDVLKNIFQKISDARPTAANLSWAVKRCTAVLEKNGDLRSNMLDMALKIQKEDIESCKKIGENGLKLIKPGYNILTHCNAGSLATGDHGTALSPIYLAKEKGFDIHVYVDETRPLLQGARLTAWELSNANIRNTVICDNMAGSLMKQGKIDIVIIGADRIAKNGDTVNKIGSYPLSILAKYHGIPFYVAAPKSTFDPEMETGDDIVIEIRSEAEMRYFNGKEIIPTGSNIYNPAFDMIPRKNITAFITDQ